MISLNRDRTAVPAAFTGTRRHSNFVELFQAAATGSLKVKAVKDKLFVSSRWSGSKGQLVIETHGKCAFCETPTSATYYGDVEHFRPKSDYWWLTYCYDNYLYACARCNGSKSDKHTRFGTSMPAPQVTVGMSNEQLLAVARQYSPDPCNAAEVASYEAVCLAEIGGLPNPYLEDPESVFAWEADDDLAEVWVVPANSDPRTQAAVAAANDIVSLNRPELLSQRYQHYHLAERIHSLSSVLSAEQRQPFLEIILDLTLPSAPFAAMMRYFARRWGEAA